MESHWPRIDYRACYVNPCPWQGGCNTYSDVRHGKETCTPLLHPYPHTWFPPCFSHHWLFVSRMAPHNRRWCHLGLSPSVSDALINFSYFTDLALCVPPSANLTLEIPSFLLLSVIFCSYYLPFVAKLLYILAPPHILRAFLGLLEMLPPGFEGLKMSAE